MGRECRMVFPTILLRTPYYQEKRTLLFRFFNPVNKKYALKYVRKFPIHSSNTIQGVYLSTWSIIRYMHHILPVPYLTYSGVDLLDRFDTLLGQKIMCPPFSSKGKFEVRNRWLTLSTI